MLTWLSAASAASAGGLAWATWRFVRYRVSRQRHYLQLAERRRRFLHHSHPAEPAFAIAGERLASEFARERIVQHSEILPRHAWQALREEAMANSPRLVRSYIPGHKQGGTLSYEAIHHQAPHCLSLYHSTSLRLWLTDLVGQPVWPTADHDQSSCSILYYLEPGDHIGWHFDHNFYRGRHFTVLVSLVNEGPHGTSQSQFQRQSDQGVQDYDTAENTLIVFEGARVRHRATPLAAGERRILLSMTFSCDSRLTLMKEFARRVKDTAFFGLSVLWR